jgi:phosphoglycolate phosphatase
MTRCLVLDLDGTLVDSAPDIATALNRLMSARGQPPFTLMEVTRMIGDGVGVLLARAFAARGVAQDAAAHTDFAADYGAHIADQTRPYPGVLATLRQMSETGWRFAVCTNKPVALANVVLEANGLAGYFAAVGGGDSFPSRKPDPAHLRATLAAAGAEAARAVMTGDHRNDIAAATGARVPCIFAAWGYGSPEMADGAAATAEKFPDLSDLADRLLPRHAIPATIARP